MRGFSIFNPVCFTPPARCAPLETSLADQAWSPSIKDTNKQALEKDTIMTSNKEPRIGVGVFVMNAEGKFVLGKRKGSHGASESLFHSLYPSTTPFPGLGQKEQVIACLTHSITW